MEVDQLVARAARAEPATSEVLRLRRRLLERGPSEILSLQPPEVGVPGARPIAGRHLVPGRRPDRVLIAHLGDDDSALVELLLSGPPGRLVLRLQGAPDERLAPLGGRTDLAIAACRADAERLRGLGFARATAVPPALSQEELARPPRAAALALPPRRAGPLVACLDPVLPGSGCEVVVQAFHVLKTYLRTDARLLFAGPREDPAHRALLRRYATELALPEVRLRSGLSAAQLGQVYERADVLLCSNPRPSPLHLLRALAFAVPVIAVASESAAELLGEAALLLDRPGPALVAEAAAAVLDQGALAARLRARAASRLGELRLEEGAGALAEAVWGVAA